MAARFDFGAERRALSGVCLSFFLMVACGRDPLPSKDGGAGEGGLPDGKTEQVAEHPPEAGTDTGVTGPDARDVREAGPDVVDAPVDVPPEGPPPCPVDCNHLPHVRAGITIGCSAGYCQVPFGSCETGFAHCSGNPNDGCEADLSRPATCGSCFTTCYAPYSACVSQGGGYFCSQVCAAPLPDTCYGSCTNLQSDFYNCGTCGNACFLPNAAGSCVQGKCTFTQCSDPAFADCTPDPGCETTLGTDQNCAACGDESCALANTVFTCSSANSCASAPCASGFANCHTASADCEASLAAGGSCLPTYLGTTPLATQVINDVALAIGTDGSYFLAGEYTGLVDFDPTAGQDVRSTSTANDVDGFITKINADGSYGWTRTFGGRGNISVQGLAAASGGAIVAAGAYNDSLDLDPGASADLHQTDTPDRQDAFVVKLAGDGSFVWGKTFEGTDFSSASDAVQVAVDGADAVYAAGSFQSTVDFDPGTATAARTSSGASGMVVKLTAAGAFSWVQTVDNGTCSAYLSSVTVGSDGAIWGVGSANTDPSCPLGSPSGNFSSNEALIVSYTAAGAARGTWTIGDAPATVSGTAVGAGPSGSIYVGGQAAGVVDFDPGSGVARRFVSPFGAGGFIVRLGSDGSFKWAQTVPDTAIGAVAGTPDGGVLGVGVSSGAFITRLGADGSGVWTFTSGAGNTGASAVAARGTTFAVAGLSSGSGDFDPGAGVDVVFGDIVYVSRFTF